MDAEFLGCSVEIADASQEMSEDSAHVGAIGLALEPFAWSIGQPEWRVSEGSVRAHECLLLDA